MFSMVIIKKIENLCNLEKGGESLKFLENDNLFDLLLLKTKRIGHGINLAKVILKNVFNKLNFYKKKSIPI